MTCNCRAVKSGRFLGSSFWFIVSTFTDVLSGDPAHVPAKGCPSVCPSRIITSTRGTKRAPVVFCGHEPIDALSRKRPAFMARLLDDSEAVALSVNIGSYSPGPWPRMFVREPIKFRHRLAGVAVPEVPRQVRRALGTAVPEWRKAKTPFTV